MLYMVVEHYTRGPASVYERAARHGRMLPDGLRYVDSWVIADDPHDKCFQLMETDDPSLLSVWSAQWSDLVEFEVVEVISSAEAAAQVSVEWDGAAGTSTA